MLQRCFLSSNITTYQALKSYLRGTHSLGSGLSVDRIAAIRAFEIYVKGERLYVAGVNDASVLTAIIDNLGAGLFSLEA